VMIFGRYDRLTCFTPRHPAASLARDEMND
jgi:hypothetical protein